MTGPTDGIVPVSVRAEQFDDYPRIREINEAAFGHPDEANLVDNLRDEGAVVLALVAELDSQIVGHILFSRMSIETAHANIPAVSLAPMAVRPSHQRHGIGSQLVRHGLAELRARGERIVLVLGHKNYYPRFGFSCDKARHLSSPFPPDAFMARELVDDALADVSGTVRYAAAFGL